MTAAEIGAELPSEQLRRCVIDSTFVLLYDREEVTKAHAAEMQISDTDGSLTQGVESARSILVRALTENAEAFAKWLNQPQQTKIALSLSMALSEDLRAQLSKHHDAEALLSILRTIDRQYAEDRTLSQSGVHRAIIVN